MTGQVEAPKPTTIEARRWARAGAALNPGIKFIAIIDSMMYSYETKEEEGHGKPK